MPRPAEPSPAGPRPGDASHSHSHIVRLDAPRPTTAEAETSRKAPSLLLAVLLALVAGVVVGELRHQQQDRADDQRAQSVATIGLTVLEQDAFTEPNLIGQDALSGGRVNLTVRVDNRGPRDVRLTQVTVTGTPLASEPSDTVLTPGAATTVALSETFTCTELGASLTVPPDLTLSAVVRTQAGGQRTITHPVDAGPSTQAPGLRQLDQVCGVPDPQFPPAVTTSNGDAGPGVLLLGVTLQNQTRIQQRLLGLGTRSGRPVTLLQAGRPADGPVVLPPAAPGALGPEVAVTGTYVCGPPTGLPVQLTLRYDLGPGTSEVTQDIIGLKVAR